MNPQILAILLSLVILVAVLVLLRFYFLPEKYAVIWLLAAIISVLLAIFPQVLEAISSFFGISQPINLIFFAGFFIVLLLLMQLSLELARTRDELRRVVQAIALELEEKAQNQDPGA